MGYRVEVWDTWNRRIAAYDDVPLLEVTRAFPDETDRIRGLLPAGTADLGPGYSVRVRVDGEPFAEATVTSVSPQWGDTRKLVLDRYVHFHEVIEFEAARGPRDGNTTVSPTYTNREVGAIVKDVINRAPGAIHYLVDHNDYPGGAEREYAKFLARKTDENELEVGGIGAGQWVGSGRIDAGAAYAKDGDTIAGLVVDGVAWPDLRFMLIDCEETSRNSHAVKRHPEVAEWTDARYAASGYKLRGDAAKDALQNWLDTKGIDYIELNPHQDAAGVYDDRVDAYGRYLGLVFGGGECFNAGLVELGHADVYLYEDGRYLVPEMELKDFYSYSKANEDSVEAPGIVLVDFDVTGGVLEVLTALAYAGNGYVWSITPDLAVRFRRATDPDRVLYFDPVQMGVTLGSTASPLRNVIQFSGNPFATGLSKTYSRAASIDEFGSQYHLLEYFALDLAEDADKLVEGVLNDVAYPEPSGSVAFFHGDNDIRVGDILELRGGPLRRLEREAAGEWDGRFAGKLMGRVKRVCHLFFGKVMTTDVSLTSPLRSVNSPLSFMVRSQPSAYTLYEFRLDDATVGLDMGYHLD